MKNKNKQKVIIREDHNIMDLITKHPEAQEVMMAFGLHCASCFASQFDTIKQGAKIHGMIKEELDEMLEEINIVINSDKSTEKNEI